MSEPSKRRRVGPGWNSQSTIPVGVFIREYLKVKKVGYAQQIWRELKKRREATGILCTTYNNILRNYKRPL